MEANKNKTFEEWKKEKPNGSLNDYYSWVRTNGLTTYDNKFDVIIPRIENNDNKKEHQSIIIGSIACVVGLVGFFTPWFSFPIFNITISGNEINQLANFMDNYYEKKELVSKVTYIKYVYAIPINLTLLLITNFFRSNVLTSILTITLLVFTGMLFGYIINNVSDAALNLVSYGLGLIALSCIVNFCNLFTLKY